MLLEKFTKKLGINKNLDLHYVEKDEENIFYLDNLGLEKLPKEIGEFKYLTVLRLDNNKLKELPIEFSNLKNLYSLNLSNNDLHKLPINIFVLQNLEYLNLEKNPNLVLTTSQINWLRRLKENGCEIQVDDNILSQIKDR